MRMRSSAIIGRDAELDVLRDARRRAEAGGGTIVIVRGEPGAGKTRLVMELAAEARAFGSVVLRGRATELGGGAYRALGEALIAGSRLVSVDTPELRPFRPALGQLVPQWREPGFVASEESPVVIGEAVIRVLTTLSARAAAILILDDMQWADPDTLRITEYLADNVHETRTLCVLTARSTSSGEAGAVIADLLRRRVATPLDIARLPDDAMSTIVREILGDVPDGVSAPLVRRAEGLPFLLEELLDAATEAGELVRTVDAWEWRGPSSALPSSVSEAVRRKLQALGDDEARIVGAAALYGMVADVHAIAQATAVPGRDVTAALRAAARVDLMQMEGSAFAFRHALTRQAILATVDSGMRIEVACALASVVDHLDPQRAAALWHEAGDDAASVRSLARAARDALDAGALSTAVAAADRAFALQPGALEIARDLDDVLSEALALSGHWERVFEVGNRLLATLVELDAPVGNRVAIYLRLARAALAAGLRSLAASHIVTARSLARTTGDETIAARIDALDAGIAMESGRVEDARRLAESARTTAERLELAAVLCEALEVLGRIERLRSTQASEAIFRSGAAIAERNGLVPAQIRALHELGIAEMFRGELATLERTRALAQSAGLLSVAVDIDHQIAGLHVFRLEPEALLDAADRALAGARHLRLDAAAAVAHVHVATAHAMRGRRVEAEANIATALRLAPNLPDVAIYAWAQGRGLGSLLQEDRSRAEDEIGQAVALALAHPAAPPGAHLALWPVLRALDDDADAVEVMRPRSASSALISGFVDYADAVIAGARGQAAAAQAAANRGDQRLEHWSGFRDLGRRLVAEAAVRHRWDDPVPWLRELTLRFAERGFPRVAAACRTLLRDAGAPVPRPRLAGPAVPPHLARLGVTARELEVMALLRDGLSNAEIASHLVLSTRTVEKHVDNLRAKTGARSRRDLARIPT